MDSNSRIVVRRMGQHDIPILTRLHTEVFKGYNTTLMGTSYLKGLYHTLACDKACTSIVAVEDNKILGWIGGVENWLSFEKALTRRSISRSPAILFSILKNRPSLFCKALSVVSGVLMQFLQPPTQQRVQSEGTPPSGSAVDLRASAILLVIGVMPERQRQGLGQLIMEDFHRRLLSRGFKAVDAKTYAYNESGNKAFPKAGYKLVSAYNGVNHYTRYLTGEGGD